MNNTKEIMLWRDAFSPFVGFRREFDRFLDDWSDTGLSRSESSYIPACDVEEQEDHFLLSVEMPGMKKDDIKMEAVNNQITISGERREERKTKEGWQSYSERKFGKFQRTFTLPVGVDTSLIEANYQDGVLRVLIPKAESSKPRQIKISNGSGSSKLLGKLLGGKTTEDSTHKDEH